MKPLLAALLLLAQTPTSPVQSDAAAIAGVVVLAETGAPLSGAKVSLQRGLREGHMFAGFEPAGTVVTDAQGRFRVARLTPGGYHVAAEMDGYVLALAGSGEREYGLFNVELTAAPVTDLVFRAVRTGVLGGKVVDADGRPVAGVLVQAYRRSYDAFGTEFFGSGVSELELTASTNDRGEYRVSVPPGSSYLVLARPASPGTRERLGAALHPGTIDEGTATRVDVGSGATRTLTDLVLRPKRLFAIRGRVIDTTAGHPPPEASVQISVSGVLREDTWKDSTGPTVATYNPVTGAFEARVGPGRYEIRVGLPMGPVGSRLWAIVEGRAMTTGGLPTFPPSARAAVVAVSGGDVEGVELRLVSPARTVAGQVTIDGQPLSPGPGWERFRVVMPGVDFEPVSLDGRLPPGPGMVEANGSFDGSGEMLGDFRVRVTGLPADVYVQSIRLGQSDVLVRPVALTGQPPGRFEIALNSHGGRIDGTVAGDSRRPAAGATAVLVPDDRTRTNVFAAVTADTNGRFTFRGVAPGTYRVCAWRYLAPFDYFDPAVLKQADATAVAVRVTEASRSTVTVALVR